MRNALWGPEAPKTQTEGPRPSPRPDQSTPRMEEDTPPPALPARPVGGRFALGFLGLGGVACGMSAP